MKKDIRECIDTREEKHERASKNAVPLAARM